ncbi:MAG: glycosyltransferase family 4 protein [Crocinitomicaceae bacterium]
MKIVQVHNFYQQAGGEDTVVASEREMLSNAGHEVIPYYAYNEKINTFSFLERIKLFRQLHFNLTSYEKCKAFLKQHNPHVCHVHNTLHLISPAIYEACRELNIPVVQTLHNYRPICSNGMLSRNDRACSDCINKSAYGAVSKKCYRNSYIQTLAVSRMIEKNKENHIWTEKIDAIICLTEFSKAIFTQAGFPTDKMHIKPNFFTAEIESQKKEDYFIFVGRLDRIKGAHLLPEIAKQLSVLLIVIGEGELQSEIEGAENISYRGNLPHKTTLSYIQKAKALILPSTVYEGMPMAMLEAFALKTPVVASNMGAMASLIDNNSTGLLFKPNHAYDAAIKVNSILNNRSLAEKIAEKAFNEYIEKYSESANLQSLIRIYKSVLIS